MSHRETGGRQSTIRPSAATAIPASGPYAIAAIRIGSTETVVSAFGLIRTGCRSVTGAATPNTKIIGSGAFRASPLSTSTAARATTALPRAVA